MFLLFLIFISQTFPDQTINDTTAEVWNTFTNYGSFGGDYYGIAWPGSSNNNYMFLSSFMIGTKILDSVFVTSTLYPPTNGEWEPGDTILQISNLADNELFTTWDDFKTNPRNAVGRHLGVSVKVHSLSWKDEPWNDFIGYELFITYDSSQCDIPGKADFLDSVYIGLVFDFDISSAEVDPNLDDLYSFDGWTFGEWDTLGYPYDSVTLLPDTFLSVPDGIWDQFQIFGDQYFEYTIHGDTFLIPRNTAFMFDDDGAGGASTGYAGIRLLYAPLSSSDSIWIDYQGDTARWVCPASVQYNYLASGDSEIYAALKGKQSITNYYRFAPPQTKPYDYRVLLSTGPFKIYHNDTISIVIGVVIGQGLNGGDDSYWGRGWIRGIRQTADYLMDAYYAGSQASDPIHPSPPNQDIHWDLSVLVREKSVIHFFDKDFYVFYSRKGIKIKSLDYAEFDLIDISGRRIFSKIITPGEKMLNIKKMRPGVYFINFEKKTFKIIKIK